MSHFIDIRITNGQEPGPSDPAVDLCSNRRTGVNKRRSPRPGYGPGPASRQLAELEQRLGVQLIQRTTHHLALTEAGRGALAEARALIIGWDALEEQYREDEVELSGGLKIVAPVALGQIYLVEAGLEFQRSNPLASFTWLLDNSPIKFAEIGCDL
ncbi:MAG: LysR family transcriptional regulator [Myxococcota bacterium]